MLWVGVDVGGTFTDAVVFDDRDKTIAYAKAPSTPGDPTQAVLEALERLEIDLAKVERFVHGITIGTNAILEGRGAPVWVLTTAGFRDVLEIARTNRPVLYDIKSLKTPPLAPRTRVLEVEERLMFDGSVRVPLSEPELKAALTRLSKEQPAALAICFLHSYANPAHEQRAEQLARELLPGWFICSSHEVLAQFREYERFNTTALNAYIGPLISRYLDRLEHGLAAKGYNNQVYIMTSNGGVSTAARARRLPVTTVLSGPAGGVAAAVHTGRLLGLDNLITCDMGGTSTDVCLIERLTVPVTNEQTIGEYANRTPQIAVNAVGAGGGSIGWLDRGGILKVGPQSAGANPGPACYGRGGLEPTVTDANLVLGRLHDGSRLAGRIALDRKLAQAAIHRLGERLRGLDDFALAEGIVRIAVATMVSAIKQISISNGYDPRDFALVAVGGAGPMHACAIAEELEMTRIVVPLGPGNFCAFGSLISDLRRDHLLTRTFQVRNSSWADIEAVFRRLEEQARAELRAEGVAPESLSTLRALGMRYLGQSWELAVEVPPELDSVQALEQAFAQVHDRRFGHKAGEGTEIVNFRVSALGRVTKPEVARWQPKQAGLQAALLERREVYFGGRFVQTAVYDRARLPADVLVAAPAIIEESGATTVVAPGWQGRVLEYGDLMLSRSEV